MMNAESCKTAATRAYSELRQRGVPDRPAFEAAVMLYRCRHPQSGNQDAIWIVAEWITEELDQ